MQVEVNDFDGFTLCLILEFFHVHASVTTVNMIPAIVFFLLLLVKFRECFDKGDEVAVYDNWSSSSENSFCQEPN